MVLSEHLVRSDTDGRDFNTHWYKWTIGRLQQVFLVVSIISATDYTNVITMTDESDDSGNAFYLVTVRER